MNREEVVNRLKDLAIRLGTPRLRWSDIKEAGLSYPIQLNFKKLGDALKEAGLESTELAEKMNKTNEELLEYISDLCKKLGKKPTVMDIKRDGVYSDKIFERRFGSIKKAYELSNKGKDVQAAVQETPSVESGNFKFQPLFYGRAGETYVVSELMYQGFNANLLPVDLGIDVVAIKENKTFYFQVKNISFEPAEIRTIQITTSAFVRNPGGNVFYMFVLKRKLRKHVLILPYQIISDLIREKLIIFNEENKDFSICISFKEQSVKIHSLSDKTKYKDVSSYLNDWNVIV